MIRYYVGIGSNIDPEFHIPEAIRLLSTSTLLVGISTFYQTPALRRPFDPPFYNGVVAVETGREPAEFRSEVLDGIEERLGRVRSKDPYAPRTVDLDVLLGERRGGGEVLPPHDDIRERAFVAVPLWELAGDVPLPGWGVGLADLAARLPRTGIVPLPEFTERLRRRFLRRLEERSP